MPAFRRSTLASAKGDDRRPNPLGLSSPSIQERRHSSELVQGATVTLPTWPPLSFTASSCGDDRKREGLALQQKSARYKSEGRSRQTSCGDEQTAAEPWQQVAHALPLPPLEHAGLGQSGSALGAASESLEGQGRDSPRSLKHRASGETGTTKLSIGSPLPIPYRIEELQL